MFISFCCQVSKDLFELENEFKIKMYKKFDYFD